jgi:O-antigen ligase
VACVAFVVFALTETTWSYRFSDVEIGFFAALVSSLLLLRASLRTTYLISPVAVLFAALATTSGAWSDYPEATFQAALVVVALLYAAMVIGSTVSTREIAAGIVSAQLLVLALSLVLVLVEPQTALVSEYRESGSLRGVFGHRNIFAFFMLVGLSASLIRWRESWRGTLCQITTASLFLGAIIASRSVTTVVVAAALLVAVLVVTVLRSVSARARKVTALGTGAFFLAGLAAILPNLGAFLGFLGRGENLTGRTVIWEVVANVARERTALGYGWGAVWGRDQAAGSRIREDLGPYPINHPHNLFLEVWLLLGLMGLVITVAGLVVVVAYSVRSVLSLSDASTFLWLSLALAITLHGLTETMMVRPLGILLFFIMLARAVHDSGSSSPLARVLCFRLGVRQQFA